MKSEHHFEKHGFSVIMEVFEFRCEFKIYQITGIEEYDGDDDDDIENVLYYEKKDSQEMTERMDEAVVFINGSVTWDGCSNWNVDNDGCMISGCSRKDLVNVGLIMAECWDLAKDKLCIT